MVLTDPDLFKVSRAQQDNSITIWSEWQDLNLRHPAPKAGGMNQTILHSVILLSLFNHLEIMERKPEFESGLKPWQGLVLTVKHHIRIYKHQ